MKFVYGNKPGKSKTKEQLKPKLGEKRKTVASDNAPAKNENDPNQKSNLIETYVLANNNIPQPKVLPEPIPLV
ncbi:Putative DNA-binding protein, YbaB/EbfC family [Leptospira santarosai]|uniref:DNA-binding protein, YbaB/EbfC family n=1 Tax=Leptospira santarosai TaxID=28183 RepID=A0A2P1QNX8_9LEPT|nr:Putative DNA-binding protein, YbaB/EbfC family [Leptospira santarosai]